MRRAAGLAAAFALLAGAAFAEGSLEGRTVTFSVEVWDDPAQPLFVGVGQTVRVTTAVEFGLEREGAQNFLDVAPVRVDIGARRVEVDFRDNPGGLLADAVFNGYVMRFAGECALFTAARIDPLGTTMPLAEDALRIEGGTLFINVAGLAHTPESRIAVDLDVIDCPMS